MSKLPAGKVVKGFVAPFSGLALILQSPGNFLLALLPFLFSAAAVAVFIIWGYWNLPGYVESFVQQTLVPLWDIFSALTPFLVVATWMGFLAAAFVVVYILVTLLAGPFLSLLAERVYSQIASVPAPRNSISLILKMFWISLLKAFLFLFLTLVTLILSFFPPLNVVGALLVILTIAFDCMDYTFEVRFFSLRERFRFFVRHFWYFAGFSLTVLFTSLVPGMFFILLPAFVAGATKLFVELDVSKG